MKYDVIIDVRPLFFFIYENIPYLKQLAKNTVDLIIHELYEGNFDSFICGIYKCTTTIIYQEFPKEICRMGANLRSRSAHQTSYLMETSVAGVPDNCLVYKYTVYL